MNREIYNEMTKKSEVFKLVKELNQVSNGKFFLYERENELVVIKELGQKVDNEGEYEIDKELFSYERLKALEINTPKLLGYNRENNIVIKEYLEGKDLLGIIRDKSLTKENIIELLRYSELLNSDNLNIDYFPANFILKEDKLYYVNYKVFPYSEGLNLRNWGIYYWINNEGIRRYMESGDEYFINVDNEKRPVITEELNKKRDELYREYVAWKHEV